MRVWILFEWFPFQQWHVCVLICVRCCAWPIRFSIFDRERFSGFTRAVHNFVSRLVWRCDLQAATAAYVQTTTSTSYFNRKKRLITYTHRLLFASLLVWVLIFCCSIRCCDDGFCSHTLFFHTQSLSCSLLYSVYNLEGKISRMPIWKSV